MIRDKHGHPCCDSCGITGCGKLITEENKIVSPGIRVVHCPFRFCRDRYLCVACRTAQKDKSTRAYHRQNGCADGAKKYLNQKPVVPIEEMPENELFLMYQWM